MTALLASLLLQANPEYRYWADQKPGAWARMKISSHQDGMAFEGEVKATLVSISAERATVERTTKMKIGERNVEETSREEVKAGEDKRVVRESDAELKIGERTLKCRLFEMKQDKGKVKMDVKWWASAEIPGGLARLEMIPEGATQPLITMTATAWEKKP